MSPRRQLARVDDPSVFELAGAARPEPPKRARAGSGPRSGASGRMRTMTPRSRARPGASRRRAALAARSRHAPVAPRPAAAPAVPRLGRARMSEIANGYAAGNRAFGRGDWEGAAEAFSARVRVQPEGRRRALSRARRPGRARRSPTPRSSGFSGSGSSGSCLPPIAKSFAAIEERPALQGRGRAPSRPGAEAQHRASLAFTVTEKDLVPGEHRVGSRREGLLRLEPLETEDRPGDARRPAARPPRPRDFVRGGRGRPRRRRSG